MAATDSEFINPWEVENPIVDCKLDVTKFDAFIEKFNAMSCCISTLMQLKIVSKELCHEEEITNSSSVQISGVEFLQEDIDGCTLVFQNGVDMQSLWPGDVTTTVVDGVLTINFVDENGDPFVIGVDSPCRIKAIVPYKIAPSSLSELVDCISSDCEC